ncbi:hypothetical protein NM208_g11605 [Fusarium decemcellulare]|uniref:Uncharacterized protein n=1 Tax=Fusarium decemcellulare TaxID=57161 RepID=A0ACC1RTK3_9HYPO|nr:hypothetical protein NM208_g11605 [Fusarium decemcellulare]
MEEPFHYEPLPGPEWIRILRLRPVEENSEPLSGCLKPMPLGDAPEGNPTEEPYEALSYCWGSVGALRSNVIQCNDQSIAIDENCHRALVHLQGRGRRTLWVDSICINQSDLQERSAQVQLMPRIFESARAVIAWVDDVGSKGALHREAATKEGLSYQTNGHDSLLQHLCQPWWRRAWTLQEVLLSRKIIIALEYEELEWEMFWARALRELSVTLNWPNPLHPGPMESAVQLYSLTSASLSLRFLQKSRTMSWHYKHPDLLRNALAEFDKILAFSATLQVQDPRDRIYALLGMLNPLGIVVPPPDYSKSPEVVFRDAWCALIGDARGIGCSREESINRRHMDYRRMLCSRTLTPKMSYGHPFWNRTQVLSLMLYHNSAKEPQHWRALPNNKALPAPNATSRLSPTPSTETEEDGAESDSSEANTDNEVSYEPFFQSYLDEHKQLLRNRVLGHLKSSHWGAIIKCTKDGGSGTDCGSSNGQTGLALRDKLGVATQVRPAGRNPRKRRDEEDDEDQDKQPPRKQAKSRPPVDPRQRFACPYFQRNPEGPRISRACRDHGFASIARLKCGDIFANQASSREHIRAKQACDATDWRDTFDPAEGFDDQQEEDIRRKAIRDWQQIFKILFPRDPEHSYPPQHPCNMQIGRILTQFDTHYHQEAGRLLPQGLRAIPCLASLVDEEKDRACAEISQLIDIIHQEIIASFRLQMALPPINQNAGLDGSRHEAHAPDNSLSTAFLDFLHQFTPQETFGQDFSTGLGSASVVDLGNSSWNLADGPASWIDPRVVGGSQELANDWVSVSDEAHIAERFGPPAKEDDAEQA